MPQTDADLGARLAARGVAAVTAAVDALVAAEREQEDRKGLTQQATRDRDTLAAEIAARLGDFRDTARVALREQPDRLDRRLPRPLRGRLAWGSDCGRGPLDRSGPLPKPSSWAGLSPPAMVQPWGCGAAHSTSVIFWVLTASPWLSRTR